MKKIYEYLKFLNQPKAWLIVSLVLGLSCLLSGYMLFTYTSEQTAYYNLGLDAYEADDFQHAMKYFDLSIAAYQQQKTSSWLNRFVHPQPSDELAAQAYFQKGKVLIKAQHIEAAVEAFKQSLRMNPGNDDEDLSLEDYERMYEEALVVKYDLEIIFKARPDLAAKQGKGQQQGKGQGNPQAPNANPAKQPGKGNRDDI
jgi:tetratricopeptide (TPR) repeat protein